MDIQIPPILPELEKVCHDIGFTMPSDRDAGSLLRSLVASKPKGRFLELGTGVGLSLAWMVDGMDTGSTTIRIDNDLELTKLATKYFGNDKRVSLICQDGSVWIKEHLNQKFDLIFADAWPGKYSELEETLNMLNPGGIYIIDDMNPQPNWPEGHQAKATHLTQYLLSRSDLQCSQLDWSTGVILATKI